MRIAFFTDDYLPSVHGVTTSIQNYRVALESLGHEVYIIAPKKRKYIDNDDHVIRLFSVNPYVFDKKPVSVLYPGIARKLDKYKFDIVHSHTQMAMSVVAESVAKRQKVPHVTTVHTLFSELVENYPTAARIGIISYSLAYPVVFRAKPVLPFTSRKEIMELSTDEINMVLKKQSWKLMVAFLNRLAGCITPSQHLADTLKQHGLKTPCEVLSNGIDLSLYKSSKTDSSLFKKRRDEKLIICVARLSGEKRQRVLIDAMNYLRKDNIRLLLVGDGPERESLEDQVEELGLEDKVIFMGLQAADKVASLLKQADIFTLPSYRFDNQPMTILEAIASGLPVVYCDDNLTEGLEPSNSVLTAGIEGEDFAKTFRSLFKNPTKLAAMSKASLEISKDFDIDSQAVKLVQYYVEQIDNFSEK